MGVNLSYTALNSKMKAMYTKHLSKENLEELLMQNSLKDAVTYLKSKYPELNNLNENMHRRDIEQELNKIFILDIVKIIKYLSTNDKKMLMEYLTKYEILSVENVFRDVVTNRSSEHYLKDVDNWTKYLFNDLKGINHVKNINEFYQIIDTKDYAKIFKEYREYSLDIPLEKIEENLDKYYFKKTYDLANKKNKKLKEIIGSEIDLLNIMWIYRGIVYYGYSIEELEDYLIPINYRITKKELEKFYEVKNYSDFQELVDKTCYINIFKNKDDMESDIDSYLYDLNLRIFRTEMFDVVSTFSYLFLIDIEIKNIINIIEGIRYKLDKNIIRKKLVI